MIDFRKFIGEYEFRAYRGSDGISLKKHRGPNESDEIDLRSLEEVRDVHYALGRYIALREEHEANRK